MGISNQLTDDAIPILLIVSWISSIRSLLFSLLQTLGLSQPSDSPSASLPAVGSGLAGLVLLADHLSTAASSTAGSDEGGCAVCMEGVKEGERIRRLGCCHLFHTECADAWFVERVRVSCPVCRSAPAAVAEAAELEMRIGAELVAWMSSY